MNEKVKTRGILFSGLSLAAIFLLLVGHRPVAGQDQQDQGEEQGLAGSWNVTLRFPQCTSTCPCPGGVPNIPIPAFHRYLREGTILEVPGGSLFRGPGVGSWQPLDDNQFVAHFKFFLFRSDTGGPRGSEVVTSQINLTGPNTFDANATFDLFDAAGNIIGQGCPINETATRFGKP